MLHVVQHLFIQLFYGFHPFLSKVLNGAYGRDKRINFGQPLGKPHLYIQV